ncbi:fatty acyl-CoA reductase 2-like [Bombus huntii]|uniref:fatty acyl-CoA reductase 2-like n=1 Tax=Bombus huntii TaxID=85661 RepID=UPI0021A9A874|nr:fatty acyl-CoA reductase 2-like [Bombus huntii]
MARIFGSTPIAIELAEHVSSDLLFIVVIVLSSESVLLKLLLRIYDNIKAKYPSVLTKVYHVKGGVSLPDLSPSRENRNVYTSLKPSEVIDMCDKLGKTSINQIEKKILRTDPNTYTFSKNLAVQIVTSKCKDLPVAIVRPSIIGVSVEEPCPGWIQNISAFTGTIMLIGRGCATAVRGRRDARSDLVPVDFVIDTIICTE